MGSGFGEAAGGLPTGDGVQDESPPVFVVLGQVPGGIGVDAVGVLHHHGGDGKGHPLVEVGCRERSLNEPYEITRPVLERYQRYLFYYRKKDGQPLTFRRDSDS
ncbi:MAG TPA: hypothetical protein VGZ29_01120 [Terriglobia bacterium]|nr:hypothetical protein [Terriglobia bacterium]